MEGHSLSLRIFPIHAFASLFIALLGNPDNSPLLLFIPSDTAVEFMKLFLHFHKLRIWLSNDLKNINGILSWRKLYDSILAICKETNIMVWVPVARNPALQWLGSETRTRMKGFAKEIGAASFIKTDIRYSSCPTRFFYFRSCLSLDLHKNP